MTFHMSPSLPRGFTLIELILAIGFFSFMSVLLTRSLVEVYEVREFIRDQKMLNYEASVMLNNSLAGLLRSGFSIRYQESHESSETGLTTGFQSEVDQISIYTDRAETQFFTIYRKPYQNEEGAADTAPLYVSFNHGQEFPLHTSEILVEDFKVDFPVLQPGEEDIHPYVKLYIRFRERDPNHLKSDQQLSRISYATTFTLRNAGPGQNKKI